MDGGYIVIVLKFNFFYSSKMENIISEVQQCYVSNTGPILLSKTAGFLATEKLRISIPYVQSFMEGWRILWTRAEKKVFLNLHKLDAKLLDGTTHPGMYSYTRRFDARKENFVLTAENSNPIPEPWNSFNSIGDFICYMKTRSSELEQKTRGKISRDFYGLNTVIAAVSESMLRPIHISTSDPDLEDPLLLFDNPLRRMNSVTSDKKWPIVQIGETGFLTAYQTADQNLATINLSHVGCTAWIVIHPSSSERLLQKIVDCIHIEGSTKIQFQCVIRNRNFSVTLDQLDKWQIKYTLLFQEEGDVVILYPGVIHARCNLSFCINSSMNFLTLHKDDVDNILNFKQCSCFRFTANENRCHGRWIPEIPLMANKSIVEWMRWALLSGLTNTSIQTVEEPVIQKSKIRSEIYVVTQENQLHQPFNFNTADATDKFPNDDTITIDISADLSDILIAENNINDKNNFMDTEYIDCIHQSDIEKATMPTSNIVPIANFANYDKSIGFIGCNNEKSVQYIFSKKTQVPEFDPELQNISTDDHCSNGSQSADTIILPNVQFNFTTIDHETLGNLGLSNVDETFKEPGEPYDLEMNHDFTTEQNDEENDKFLIKCPQCSRKLSNHAHLKRHIYLKHSSEDISVSCPICMRRFANKMSLENHRRSKSGGKNTIRKRNRCRGLTERVPDDKRIRCQFEFCKQLFVLKSGYFRHLRKVHQYHIKPGIDQIQREDSAKL